MHRLGHNALADAAITLATAWTAWSATALLFFLRYAHLFGGGSDALEWYVRGALLVGATSLLPGVALGFLIRCLLPSRLARLGSAAWLFAAVLAAVAAVPLVMWIAYAQLEVYAFGSREMIGGVAAGLLALALLLAPAAALLFARFVRSTRRLLEVAVVSALAALLVGATRSAPAIPAIEIRETAESSPPSRAFRPNVVLVTLDALRADHLSCYGYARPTSPSIDALARDATLFQRVYAARPKTSPSFASILTGLRPARHGLRVCPSVLADDHVTLAEVLSANGYGTAAWVENPNLQPALGFGQGFTRYEARDGDPQAMTAEMVAWLEAKPREPFFVWRHYVDPHAPYAPPEPYATTFSAKDGSEDDAPIRFNARGSAFGGPLPIKGHEPARPLADYVARYDAEIRFTDDQVGAILSALERTGLRQRSIVVFTSDHGESLGEHDYYFEHGVLAYDGAARVPLLISVPESLGIGALLPRVARAADNVDLYPTILDLCGLAPPAAVDGASLVPRMRGGAGDAGIALFEAGDGDHMGPGWLDSVVDGRWKYVRRRTAWMKHPRSPRDLLFLFNALAEGGLEPDELYDLDADPAETINLVDREAEIAGRLRAELETRLLALPPAPASVLATQPAVASLDERTRAALEQLGYGAR